MNRYFIGFLVAIGLIILLIVLLFTGGSGSKSKVPNTPRTLVSYASSDATASLTIDGPINADQNHQSVKITVGQNDATYEQFNGYNGSVANSQTFANTEAGYSAFLSALTHAGFTLGKTSTAAGTEAGYCPTGERYVLEFSQDGKDIERFWSTSCSGTPNSFQGNLGLNLTLFEAQIPNFDDLSQNVNINS